MPAMPIADSSAPIVVGNQAHQKRHHDDSADSIAVRESDSATPGLFAFE